VRTAVAGKITSRDNRADLKGRHFLTSCTASAGREGALDFNGTADASNCRGLGRASAVRRAPLSFPNR
jgi:hypothetical protein